MASFERWLMVAAGVALATATPSFAVEPARLTGTLAGRVMDAAGVPQMGATVFLFNRYDRMVARLLTNDKGGFQFDQLLPDVYSIRVRLASFVPALKRNIAIQPGMRSFLAINLNSMLSSIELVYTSPGQTAIMSDDWKWVLRSAGATRPILRVLDQRIDISDPSRPKRQVFSGTRGLFRISSGESEGLSSFGTQADLGTAFALATSVYGFANVSVSGNFGYASNTGTPTAGFSTSFSRSTDGTSPTVNVTMRQMMLPTRLGGVLSNQGGDLPALQTMAVTYVDRRQLAEGLQLEYGSSLESVSFLSRLNYVSPFARLSVGSVQEGALEFGYSSGAPATQLLNRDDISNAELQHNLNTLSLFPRVSLRGGRAEIQRSQNFELGYRRTIGSRTFSGSAYREGVTNAAFNASAPNGSLLGDLLPDLASRTSVFNAGSYRRMGYTAAVTQQLGDNLNATLSYGYNGSLGAREGDPLGSTEASQVRSLLAKTGRHSMTAKLAGTAPATGTRYMASYQFTDYSVLTPVHLSLTQRTTLEPGLNFYLRQPIPRVGSIVPGRLEATAELRNVLGQGYLPIATPGGYKLVLIQTPKAVRGGLSLIF